jgi:hypothetical protein
MKQMKQLKKLTLDDLIMFIICVYLILFTLSFFAFKV